MQSTNSTTTAAEIAASNITAAGIALLAIQSYSGDAYSEDCLFLNVWTKPQVGEKKKAVLVFIFGGGFFSGTSSIPGYAGANIAEQEDVIVVSFKYVFQTFCGLTGILMLAATV